jgi:hypothetical protein
MVDLNGSSSSILGVVNFSDDPGDDSRILAYESSSFSCFLSQSCGEASLRSLR